MDIALTGSGVLIAIVVFALITVLITQIIKAILRSKNDGRLTEKYSDTEWTSPLQASNKYPDVNIFNYSGPIFKYGVMASVLIALLAFSWTSYEKAIFIPDDALEFDEEIEQIPPRTAEPPPPPPPPPPPVIEEVPEEEILEEDEPVFEDTDIEEETVIEEAPIVEEAPPPPPPPPPPPEPEVEEIFKVVEQMPRFPGCEDISGTDEEKKACAQKKMLEYIYKNLKYPAIARENGIEGMAVIQFVVGKDGSVKDAKIVRNLEGGCGEAALTVVDGMNNLPQKWTPGRQRGRNVKVLYTLPVRFKLQD